MLLWHPSKIQRAFTIFDLHLAGQYKESSEPNPCIKQHAFPGFILKVEAMLDKTICAMSSVFIGAPGSTFTEDILRLRKDWGSASMCDEYLCQGEEPNFIADNEWRQKLSDVLWIKRPFVYTPI